MTTARKLSEIMPGRTDRAICIGQTGSGKTTLAQFLCATREYVVVLDAKGMIRWPGYTRVTSLDRVYKLKAADHPKIVYAPSYEELQDADTVDEFFRWVYTRRHCTVYVDEVAAIATATEFPFHLGACYMRGRERGVEIWASTQRPSRIPLICYSEAEHAYVFRLNFPADRQRVEDMTGIHGETLRALAKREFIYAPQEGDFSPPMKLELGRAS
jgi:hypothetical protein